MAITWNSSDKDSTITLSNGDLSCEANANPSYCVRATESKSSGKYYWEVYIDLVAYSTGHYVGVADSVHPLGVNIGTTPTGDAYAYLSQTGYKAHETSAVAYGDTYATGDIIGVALDLDNGKIWFAKNNVWQDSGDPAAGTGEAYSGLSGSYFPIHEPKQSNGNTDKATLRPDAATQTYGAPAGFAPLDGGYIVTCPSPFTAVGSLDIDAAFIGYLVDCAGNFAAAAGGPLPVPMMKYIVSPALFTGISGLSAIPPIAIVLTPFIADSQLLANTKIAIIPPSPFIGDSDLLANLKIGFSAGPLTAVTGGSITRIWYPLLDESIFLWADPKWAWGKSIADSMAIADSAEKILGIPVSEVLTLADSQVTQWKGTENIADNLFLVDIPKVVEIFEDLVADGMAVVDAARIVLELMITDILTCTDFIVDVGKFQFSASETLTLEDIARKAWEKTAADALTIADSNILLYLALPLIADAFAAVDATTPGLTINQVIADALQALDTASLQQIIQELIADGLALDILVELDGKYWECWILNTAAFHPSIYSNYGFNSFAIDKINNTVYGCKNDGIYELTGSTDDGTPFHSGIVLPETMFGTTNVKKFRKAMLGVSGDNLVMKAETESGSKTFKMTNARVNITRDLRGRSWKFSLEDFDSLDMIELYPVILSKK